MSGTPQARRTRGRPRLEDIAEIESALLSVALREFIERGYGATAMARIVRAAGISKTTLYSRFSSKEDLFRAIMRRQIERLAAGTALARDDAPPDLEAGLRIYADRALEYSFQSDMLQVNRLIYSEAHRFAELGAAAAEATQIGIDDVSDFIRRCAEADGIPCRDPRTAAEVFIFMLRGWYVNAMLTNRPVPRTERQEWVERAVRTLMSGRGEW